MIHQMYMAETKENALKAYRHFLDVYSDKYPKAVECLKKDEEVLFSFYNFPAVHWIHIRGSRYDPRLTVLWPLH